MKNNISPTNLVDGYSISFTYEEENTCPICKANISPKYLSSAYFMKYNDVSHIAVSNYCTGCKSVFVTDYEITKDVNKPTGSSTRYYCVEKKVSSEPNRFVAQVFDKHINNLSPSFVKIYNQALAAESRSLDEIAGLGYRKSLEFLIKDFAIAEHPDDEGKIKSMMLSPCIKNYIDDHRIKTLAEKSAWIGNDEAHYVRKQEDRDVSDMKNFITATVYFISMILITKDAETIPPK